MNKFLTILLVLFFDFYLVHAKSKPNVVLILIDDLGWTDLSVMGSKYYQSPNVDKLADDGVLFSNAYSSCTVCSPSRASIMTGKYPAKLNCTDWIKGYYKPHGKLLCPEWTMFLDTSEYTLAEAFKDNGYTTAHIGKWHLGEKEQYWPEFHGFDLNIGGWKKGAPNLNKAEGFNGYFPPYGNPRLKDQPNDSYLTERIADEACNFIKHNNPNATKKPFFLNLWMYAVHTPLQAKEEKIQKFKSTQNNNNNQHNPIYAAMIEHMDEAVGKVIKQLKKDGLYENTIIIFTSDNGGLVGRKNWHVTDNSPLRHGKGGMYEGGVRVPFIIKDIKNSKKKKSDLNIISADIFPTLIGLTDIKIDKKIAKNFDGIDISTNIRSAKNIKRKAIFWHYPHYHIEGAVPYSAVKNGDWKLIKNLETENFELYNLKEDIGEKNNLVNDYPNIVNEMIKMLDDFYQTTKAQMPKTNPDFIRNDEKILNVK